MAGFTAKQLHRVIIEFLGPMTKGQVKAVMAALRAASKGARIRQEKIIAVQKGSKPTRPRRRKGGK